MLGKFSCDSGQVFFTDCPFSDDLVDVLEGVVGFCGDEYSRGIFI